VFPSVRQMSACGRSKRRNAFNSCLKSQALQGERPTRSTCFATNAWNGAGWRRSNEGRLPYTTLHTRQSKDEDSELEKRCSTKMSGPKRLRTRSIMTASRHYISWVKSTTSPAVHRYPPRAASQNSLPVAARQPAQNSRWGPVSRSRCLKPCSAPWLWYFPPSRCKTLSCSTLLRTAKWRCPSAAKSILAYVHSDDWFSSTFRFGNRQPSRAHFVWRNCAHRTWYHTHERERLHLTCLGGMIAKICPYRWMIPRHSAQPRIRPTRPFPPWCLPGCAPAEPPPWRRE